LETRNRTLPHSLGLPIIGGGFPHSEIHGSKPVRGSPWLIAAYHVFHRLSVPRHPPNALTTLDRSHDRCPLLGRGWRGVVRQKASIRNLTSLLHDRSGTGGQARSHLGLLCNQEPSREPGANRNNHLFTMSDNLARTSRWTCRRNLFLLRTNDRRARKRILVEPDGIEPTTSCLQSTRSPS
jgi:hypothetical protein